MNSKNRFKAIFLLAIIFIFTILFIYPNKCFALNPKIITFEKTYGGPGNDVGSSVQQTTDGGYIIVGTTGDSPDSSYVYLIKTDKFGNLLWQKKFGDCDGNSGSCVRQTHEGGYIITGAVGESWMLDSCLFNKNKCLWRYTMAENVWWKTIRLR